MGLPAEEIRVIGIDVLDASDDGLRLAVARAMRGYDEDELFACLADPDTILRTSAARALHVRGTRRSFDHVLALAGHPRYEMREIAAFVLGQLGTPAYPYAAGSFPILGRLMEDPYWEVRRAAAGAVGTLSGPGRQADVSVQGRLVALAVDKVPDVRASVAVALGMIDDPRARACLERLLDDDEPVVRDDAELGLELLDIDGDGEAGHERVAAE